MSTPEEDEAWRTIVENYGERPAFPEEQARAAREPEPAPRRRETEHPELLEDPGAHFVPEPAPPVVLPRGRRLAAWLGILGVPLLVLVGVALGIRVPGWFGFALLVWFVGGFVYLVATMHKGPEDGWDDGAVV